MVSRSPVNFHFGVNYSFKDTVHNPGGGSGTYNNLKLTLQWALTRAK